jgi:hypothetical protein
MHERVLTGLEKSVLVFLTGKYVLLKNKRVNSFEQYLKGLDIHKNLKWENFFIDLTSILITGGLDNFRQV